MGPPARTSVELTAGEIDDLLGSYQAALQEFGGDGDQGLLDLLARHLTDLQAECEHRWEKFSRDGLTERCERCVAFRRLPTA